MRFDRDKRARLIHNLPFEKGTPGERTTKKTINEEDKITGEQGTE